MVRPLRLFAIALTGALALLACQVVVGIDRVDKVAPDAGGAVDGAVADPCQHVLPRDPPEVDDDKDFELPPMYLAVRTVSLTPTLPDQSYAGLDLDGVCTCDRRPGSAHEGQTSCTPKAEVCDGDGGADNKGAVLFKQFEATGAGSVNDGILQGIDGGSSTLLVWIAGWNGKPNDREIKVGVILGTGITDPSGCNVQTTDDSVHYHPGWCGGDKWNYAPAATVVVNGQLAPISNGLGYVSGGQLVYKSQSPVEVVLGRASVAFNSPTVFGTLEATGTGYKLSGMLGGRLEIAALLGAIGQFKLAKIDICNTPTFDGIRSILCNAVDITRTSVFDFQSASCDAISSAMQFTAELAKIGTEVPRSLNDSPCDPSLPENKPKYVCP